MHTKLKNLIQHTHPRKISQAIKKDVELYKEINKCFGKTIAEKTYNFINTGNNHICPCGNTRKFKTLQEGYGFCGKPNSCECARQSVSKNVSKAKQQYSDEQTASINAKRKKTMLKKYNVSNAGQTVSAKLHHTLFYKNTDNVTVVTSQIKQTKKQKYGDENYNNSEQIKQTFKERYPVEYYVERYNNENLILLQDKEYLSELYNTHSIYDIADLLNVHIQTVYKYLNKYNIRQPFKSSEEMEVVRFLESLGITNIIKNSRKILDSGKEIDIYLPDYNIAIEYNGVYWHHEDINHITRSYHYEKYKECENKGIQLITIFSNFWKTKPEIVKNAIINKLKLSSDSIYARDCQVKEMSSKDSREFLKNTHIQGYTPATIIYGLLYKNELVALMSFGKQRIGIGKNEGSYELIRFASATRIVGGAGKLLTYFIKHNNPTKIISYSDNEWSNGNLYNTLGFILEKEIPPSYWYLKPREERLYHRFNFSKHKLVEKGYDPTLTERQITKQMGLLKIWDCGKKRWAMYV